MRIENLADGLHLNTFLLCEDAREEVNSKYTVTGLFAGDEIKVAAFPASIRLAAFVDFIFEKRISAKSKLRVSFNGEPLFTAEVELAAPADHGHMVLLLPSFNLPAAMPGQIMFEVQVDDGEWHSIDRRNLTQGDIYPPKPAS